MENNKQQTAVEWLIDSIKINQVSDVPTIERIYKYAAIVREAKQMDKEQIKAAYNKGYQDGEIDSLDAKDGDVQSFDDAENYYTETYMI